jgi:hypothetical protein
MCNRPTFMEQTIGSVAWVAASGLMAPGRILGANERIGIGLIGAGSRGQEMFRAALCEQFPQTATNSTWTGPPSRAKRSVTRSTRGVI